MLEQILQAIRIIWFGFQVQQALQLTSMEPLRWLMVLLTMWRRRICPILLSSHIAKVKVVWKLLLIWSLGRLPHQIPMLLC